MPGSNRGLARWDGYAREVSASSVVLFPHAPSSVGVARRALGADLRAHGTPEGVIADAILVLSELLSNAIRHGRPLPGGQVEVSWTLRGGTLEIAVTDSGGPTRPEPSLPPPSAVGGRGLSIVERLSRRWGVRVAGEGVTVWAQLRTSRRGVTRLHPRRFLTGAPT